MIPAGAKPFRSEIGQNLTVTFTVPGVYGYRCTPHGTLGMVGLIVVGAPVNESAAKSAAMPGAAGRVFAKLFQALDSARTAAN
jgi:pseudoazurin